MIIAKKEIIDRNDAKLKIGNFINVWKSRNVKYVCRLFVFDTGKL